MRHVPVQERRARLGRRHLLAAAGASPAHVAEAVVGLHSSDPATVFLSLQARIPGFGHCDLEDALYEQRTLLRMLGMRRTMFVVTRPVAAVMNSACTRDLVAAERRRLAMLIQEQGLAPDGEEWVTRVCAATLAAIEARGAAVATELRADVPELTHKITFGEGKKWGGEVGVSTRVLFLLATDAEIIRGRPRGTWLSSQYRWAPLARWLGGPLPHPPAAEARAELARRWLYAFGPGTLTDLKWWTGWSVANTKAALAAMEAVEIELDEGTGFVLPDDVAPVAPVEPWAALLPSLDPTPMGWKDRGWFVGDHSSVLYDRNGNIGPTVWCDGRIVGGWGQTPAGRVAVELLEPVDTAHRRLIEERRAALETWLDPDRIVPRFRTPIDKRLAVD